MINKLFIIAAAVGLAINLYGDLVVLNQNTIAIETGNWVNHSHDILDKINIAKLSLYKIAGDAVTDSEFLHLMTEINSLTSETAAAPPSSKDRDRLLAYLNQLSLSENAKLAERIKIDTETSNSAVEKSIVANGCDILLIFLFIIFFFYERRKSSKVQKLMSEALAKAQTSYTHLQAVLINRDHNFKSVVHDLKNPIGSIRGFAELLHDDASDRDSVIEMADIIQKISDSTLALVSTALHENGIADIPDEEFSLMQLVQEVCNYLEPVATKKGQRIEIKMEGTDFRMLFSKQRAQDVFFNLIGNALKFSPKNTVVHLESSWEKSYFILKVSDEGPGFHGDDFCKLFVPEAKLSARPTGNEQSTGFGLYSVKRTVDCLNGVIEVCNNHDVGATITLKIPVSKTQLFHIGLV